MPDTEKMLELAIELLNAKSCPPIFACPYLNLREDCKACWRKYLEHKARDNDDRA